MNIYDIKKEFFAIQELVENEEFDEETGELIDNSKEIQELLDSLKEKRDLKADNIAYLIKSSLNSQDSIENEITRLKARKEAYTKQETKLKDLLIYLLAGEKLKTDRFTYSYRKSSSVKIVDESLISLNYFKTKEVVTIDKMAIKEDLRNGLVSGAEIETKNNLTIK